MTPADQRIRKLCGLLMIITLALLALGSLLLPLLRMG